jgi:glycosyltransferase involved in cell wall biosynthesis
MTKVTFITDPLVTTAGAVRPAILLARELRKCRKVLTIVTPRSDDGIAESLRAEGIEIKNVGPRFSLISSFPTFDAWARCLITNKTINLSDDLVVNTSSCLVAPAHVYYAQGLMTKTLNDIFSASRSVYSYTYNLLKRPLLKLEKRLAHRFSESSHLFVANSSFCASMYQEWGIRVQRIINPPLDCDFFKPSSMNPSADYVLTTLGKFGKEGNLQVIKAIADAGVKLKVFGDSQIPDLMKKTANITLLGKVSDEELVRLYSNALYTLFAFDHEPFGYIPVESMGCGTPVLTFNRQGPSETVVDGRTGWLADSNQELLVLAVRCWDKGYDSAFRTECRKRAIMYGVRKQLDEWKVIFKEELARTCKQERHYDY